MCGSMPWQAAPPLQASWYCTSHFQLCHSEKRGGVIDQGHQGDGGLDSSSRHSWGNTGSFLKLSCSSEALHLLEQSRESSCFLLYEPVVLTEAPKLSVTVPQKHSVPLPRPVHALIPKRRGSGKKEGGLYKTNK